MLKVKEKKLKTRNEKDDVSFRKHCVSNLEEYNHGTTLLYRVS